MKGPNFSLIPVITTFHSLDVAVLGLVALYVPLLAHGVVVYYLLVTGHHHTVLKALANGKNCHAHFFIFFCRIFA